MPSSHLVSRAGVPVPASRGWLLELLWLLRRAARELGENDPLRLGAATAFFTSFALPPILIILIQVLGSLSSSSQVQMLLLGKLGHLLGASATGLLTQILHNVTDLQRSRLVTWLGSGFLLFVATTLFTIIQHSLNQLWQMRPHRHTGQVRQALRERLRSGGVLLVTAGLTLLAFASDAGLALFADFIRDFDATFVYFLVRGLNALVGLAILTAWCAYIFRTLSSAKVPWRAVSRGALLTALLISTGEGVLSRLLVARDLGPIYGPASSLVLVLLFVFYSAMIFYFGACFTKVYAHRVGLDIKPKKSAVRYRLVNVSEEAE